MSDAVLLKGARLVNEGKVFESDLLIRKGRIERIDKDISPAPHMEVIELDGRFVLPGCIDDQVHFREPGLTHKGSIETESRAAVAGGITSFMEMPNTFPNALTQELLEDKYQIAARSSVANYSFFMGASNDNTEEVLKTNMRNVCGVKIFMGSSTGNMLVDQIDVLEKLFERVPPMLIATHCEDEKTVRKNLAHFQQLYGEQIPIELHPVIRSEEACYKSSSLAVELAKKYGSRLHVLHISTEKELSLFDNSIPLNKKRITAEACIHHLWFSEEDYSDKGSLIKWNPAVKKTSDRDAVFDAVLDGRIDVIATDHAPHTLDEKSGLYTNAPSGGPLVQHALLALLQKMEQGKITFPQIVEKMAHNPSILFRIEDRGFLREGYYADLVVVAKKPHAVTKESLLYKCGWSPFEGQVFDYCVEHTFVNGQLVFSDNAIRTEIPGQRLLFNVTE
jgi:dihydroorotase